MRTRSRRASRVARSVVLGISAGCALAACADNPSQAVGPGFDEPRSTAAAGLPALPPLPCAAGDMRGIFVASHPDDQSRGLLAILCRRPVGAAITQRQEEDDPGKGFKVVIFEYSRGEAQFFPEVQGVLGFAGELFERKTGSFDIPDRPPPELPLELPSVQIQQAFRASGWYCGCPVCCK
jgi:hypothetical protein